jgi:hypothetical protein
VVDLDVGEDLGVGDVDDGVGGVVLLVDGHVGKSSRGRCEGALFSGIETTRGPVRNVFCGVELRLYMDTPKHCRDESS